ncbi:hypothetical protein HJFPF1_03677 [Paramyrothecium foliicola]|nr:hypothetical protein HJFPF1_03677 [Paramyrothecium foliicola]
MAAINALVTRDAVMHQLAKRQNWAQQEPGVITVFCIVFVGTISFCSPAANPTAYLIFFLVAVGIAIAQIYKCLQRRKLRNEAKAQQ